MNGFRSKILALFILCLGWPSGVTSQEVTWRIGQLNDTTFYLPRHVSAAPTIGTAFVVDSRRPAVIELDLASGLPLRSFGREGDGPGEFRNPVLVDYQPALGMIAVLDAGRSAVEVFGPDHSHIARIPITPRVWNPKDLLMTADSVFYIAGGAVEEGEFGQVQRVLWSGTSVTLGPPAIGGAEDNPISRRLLSGGVLKDAGHGRIQFVEAATGKLFVLSGEVFTEAKGSPVPPTEDLVARAITVDGENTRYWWSFPQAMLSLKTGGAVGFSYRNERRLEFWAYDNGASLGAWVGEFMAADDVDGQGAVTIHRNAAGEFVVERRRYPSSVSNTR
jgi:hypothetical protein